MNEMLAFLSASAISFWGSLQLGPVNACVIQTALHQGKKQALMVATGGVIPELIYSGIAVAGAGWIHARPEWLELFGWLFVAVLLTMGCYLILKPHKPPTLKPVSQTAGFLKGFLLALFNPQLLPFWLGILVYLEGYIAFKQGTLFSPYIAFVAGTAFGAWVLLYFFTRLSIHYKEQLNRLLKQNLNRWVGGLFILMAVLELIRRFS